MAKTEGKGNIEYNFQVLNLQNWVDDRIFIYFLFDKELWKMGNENQRRYSRLS